jgi:hypothetical protein
MPVAFSVFLLAMGYVAVASANNQLDIAEVHYGNAYVQYGPEGSVFLFVHTYMPDGSISSQATTVYLFQTDDQSKHYIPSTVYDVEIVGKEKSLKIKNETHNMLLALPGESSGDTDIEIIYGFGLAKYYGISLTPAELVCLVFPEDCATKDKPPLNDSGDGGQSASCQAGGNGSTACSITCNNDGCSTSCAPNFYACCNCYSDGPSCKCLPYP